MMGGEEGGGEREIEPKGSRNITNALKVQARNWRERTITGVVTFFPGSLR